VNGWLIAAQRVLAKHMREDRALADDLIVRLLAKIKKECRRTLRGSPGRAGAGRVTARLVPR